MLGLSDLRSLVYTKRVRQTIHEIHGNLHQMFQTTIFEKKWFLLKFSTTVENVLLSYNLLNSTSLCSSLLRANLQIPTRRITFTHIIQLERYAPELGGRGSHSCFMYSNV